MADSESLQRHGRPLSGALSSIWSKVLSPVAVGVIIFFVGVAWGKHEARPTVTQRVLFHPSGYGVPARSLDVVGQLKGKCFANLSIADSGMGETHRCFAASGRILDPCWGSPVDPGVDPGVAAPPEPLARVVCADDPWSGKVVLLRVTRWDVITRTPPYTQRWDGLRDRKVTFRRANMGAPPWALRLLNGDRCVFASGTADVIAGIRANYLCERGVGVGQPRRSAGLWTIMYLRNDRAETMPEAIEKVWY
jgi:hypothetical protein